MYTYVVRIPSSGLLCPSSYIVQEKTVGETVTRFVYVDSENASRSGKSQ